MKSAVVFYSHYGNTAYVVDRFCDVLRAQGKADVFELEYLHAKKGLLRRFVYRIFPFMVRLSPINLDLKEYDLLFLGIPVWGGKPSAPVSKYMLTCKNIAGKKIICCYVYGIEASARKCAKYVERTLQRKGCSEIFNIYFPWSRISDEEFLDQTVRTSMDKISLEAYPTP